MNKHAKQITSHTKPRDATYYMSSTRHPHYNDEPKKLKLIPLEHRAKVHRAKLTKLYAKINRRQIMRNGCATEIQEHHRLAAEYLENPTLQQVDDISPMGSLTIHLKVHLHKSVYKPEKKLLNIRRFK